MLKVIKYLNGALYTVISVFLSTMVILVFLNVVLRYAFDSGITWSEELARYLFVWVVFLGAIVAFKDKSHLGVDLLIGALPPVAQKVLYTIVNVVIIIVLALVVDGGYKMMELNSNSYAPATGIPLWLLFLSGTFAAVVMILQSITQTVRFVCFNQDPPAWANSNNDLKEEGS
ncbi:TRAP transporter small permease [Halalkalibacter kiskunsagensis]|uniref:TRAP transporter small permease n=1 Tax=Halalkalibacter kiskunsagensis TaxID=1548599 RepID=A0ABV6KD76_9BACI